MDINAYLRNTSSKIEQKLDQLIPEKDVPYGKLFQAARYALLNGGKKLRPILTLATAETIGSSCESALCAACAIEMVHTYSLIHDDLPCMDNDDFRRGKPSLHNAFGEGNAVLAGDFLLSYAFEVITSDPLLLPSQKVELVRLLAAKCGGSGMIAGQVMDIEAGGLNIDLASLELIHQYKTGAMITASIEFGGIIANASFIQMEALRSFGNHIGLAFQIIDDVIDVVSSQQKHGSSEQKYGKTIPSDELNNKTTYVTLLGLAKAKETANNLLEEGVKHLALLKCDSTLLQSLAKRLVHRDT